MIIWELMPIFVVILMIILYLLVLFLLYNKNSLKRSMVKKFHNVVVNILSNTDTDRTIIKQLKLNYQKLSEETVNNPFKNLLDILEWILHYYDIAPQAIRGPIFGYTPFFCQ